MSKMLCLFSKSNPQKGRWSTLPEDTAINALPMIGTGDRTATLQADRSIPTLGQRWCWILYNSQVVDRVITIVHHSRYYVTICHYMSLYVYDIKKNIQIMSWFSHSDAISWYSISFHFKAKPRLWGSMEQLEQLEQDQIWRKSRIQ